MKGLNKVFVYGSLMSQRVLRILLGRAPRQRPAQLAGYHRFRIVDRVFPAIRPLPPALGGPALGGPALGGPALGGPALGGGPALPVPGPVDGILLDDLNDAELAWFDVFEDDDYTRESLPVLTTAAFPAIAAAADAESAVATSTEETAEAADPKAVAATPEVAFVYVWKEEHEASLFGTWEYEEHFVPHEDSYCKGCESFAEAGHSWSFLDEDAA